MDEQNLNCMNQFKCETSREFPVTLEEYVEYAKKNQKMSTCNGFDLETLGYWLIMPKNPIGFGL